jgi:hypothetical protein
MATTINSTELDFDAIKNSLKTFLAQQPDFADYNFEASGLSSLLDVLAYNTHYNGLLANFALNESFLSTAQLRSSLIGLAGSLGYQVGSRKASRGVVNITVTNNANPSSMTIPAGFIVTSTVDNQSFTFVTRDTLIATNSGDGSNLYTFALDGNKNVPVFEGVAKTKTFIAGPASEDDTYVIPVNTLDLDTVVVKVYDSVSSSTFDRYININDASSIDATSKLYIIKETPNGFYEITFGNGTRLGNTPQTGQKIVVEYSTTSGPGANGARNFAPSSTIAGFAGVINVVTVSSSTGGSFKEELESIRKNAPYLYASQNRMVTASDYSALIRRNFPNVIEDIKSWGGEENVPPKYGSVFVSIDFSTDDTTIQSDAKADIKNLAKNLSVASFDVEFTDPLQTFLEVDVVFQFNPNLTSQSQTAVESLVRTTMQNYFATELGGFDESFRRSNLLTAIDASEQSILSSRAILRMQNRFVPKSAVVNYSINFPSSIATPDDVDHRILSGNFTIANEQCFFRNALKTSNIEVVRISDGAVLIDNIGSYDASTGVITLSNFTGELIGDNIKITATPANESVIIPQRENLLLFDNDASSVRAVITSSL